MTKEEFEAACRHLNSLTEEDKNKKVKEARVESIRIQAEHQAFKSEIKNAWRQKGSAEFKASVEFLIRKGYMICPQPGGGALFIKPLCNGAALVVEFSHGELDDALNGTTAPSDNNTPLKARPIVKA